jgi:hypothetical protein
VDEITLDLLREYRNRGFIIASGSFGTEGAKFAVQPERFLSFAEKDLKRSSDRNLVNALSNIKRAIDCQMDSLLTGFCLYERSKKENWKYPRKVETLNRIGVVSPRILSKINQKRNLLEHEYELPKREDVKDALDVATLFLHYTSTFLLDMPNEFHLQDYSDGETAKANKRDGFVGDFEFIFNDKSRSLIIIHTTTGGRKLKEKLVPYDSEEYLDFLRFILEMGRD